MVEMIEQQVPQVMSYQGYGFSSRRSALRPSGRFLLAGGWRTGMSRQPGPGSLWI